MAPALVRTTRHRLAPAAKRLLFRFGVSSALRKWTPNRGLAILRYHAICGEEGHAYASPGICISPRAFEAHVRYLVAHYKVLSLPEAVARLREADLPRNSVAITFDDGYADNLAAAKILHRHGASATFYIAAGCLVGGQPFWPAELRQLLDRMAATAFAVEVDGKTIELRVGTESERGESVSRLTAIFKSHPIPMREQVREQLRHLAGYPVLPDVMLTWDQVREMQRLGMTIGAHTLTHPNLPSAGLEMATQEIAGSKRRLDAELQTETTMFSYPNGGAEVYVTPEIQSAVAEAGFAAASTSRNGFASRRSDLYALERVKVEERLDDLAFALEVERFAFSPVAGQGGTRS